MPHEDAEKGYAQEPWKPTGHSTTDAGNGAAEKQRQSYADVVESLGSKAQAGCGAVPLSPLRARLQNDVAELGPLIDRTFRAEQILRQHPEFEVFLELLELLGVAIPALDAARKSPRITVGRG